MIEITNLTKYFVYQKKIIKAVEAINLEIQTGQVFGLVGPNGAGKTTLLKLLATLILPTKGRAVIQGYDLIKDSEKVRTLIGFVSGEERGFYWRLNGRQNLEFFASLYNISSSQTRKRIQAITQLLELENIIDLPLHHYSSGMKQKIALGRALLPDPPILLIDEFGKSLDTKTSAIIGKFIREKLIAEQNKTIILTTHNVVEATAICDYVAIMDKGKICSYEKFLPS